MEKKSNFKDMLDFIKIILDNYKVLFGLVTSVFLFLFNQVNKFLAQGYSKYYRLPNILIIDVNGFWMDLFIAVLFAIGVFLIVRSLKIIYEENSKVKLFMTVMYIVDGLIMISIVIYCMASYPLIPNEWYKYVILILTPLINIIVPILSYNKSQMKNNQWIFVCILIFNVIVYYIYDLMSAFTNIAVSSFLLTYTVFIALFLYVGSINKDRKSDKNRKFQIAKNAWMSLKKRTEWDDINDGIFEIIFIFICVIALIGSLYFEYNSLVDSGYQLAKGKNNYEICEISENNIIKEYVIFNSERGMLGIEVREIEEDVIRCASKYRSINLKDTTCYLIYDANLEFVSENDR